MLAHVAKGLRLATWAVLTSCSPSKQKLASNVLLSCLGALLPSTRATSKHTADGLLNLAQVVRGHFTQQGFAGTSSVAPESRTVPVCCSMLSL